MATNGGNRIRSHGPAPSNVDVAVEAIREAVIRGWLPPGERIKEVPLAERLGISRGPIREALRLLEYEGLVQIMPNRGATVPVPTSADVLEVYALRSALGSLALHKLLREDADVPAAELTKQLARFEKAVADGKAARAADADLAYQSAVVAAAGLPRVVREFDRLTWQVRVFIASMEISYGDKLGTMLDEVRALHEAIVVRDVATAELRWREKFERWVRDFIDQMTGGFDLDLWAALTSGAELSSPQ
jgi:DNA-binding GntR family transcriptional regulator